MTITDLFTSAIRLREGGLVQAEQRRMSGADADVGWHVAAFHVETDADVHADHWEMHPESEEAVCVLAGGVRLFVRAPGDDAADPDADEGPVVLGPGAVYIVPRGRWHRLEVDEPSDLMSIGLRAGTRLARRVEGMGAA
ncbi:cupin domain-containing protein [Streptomyces sp. SID3343]|uniref:cupin domain-containing protein n=1 Tax=Streptomyces sp. SID3343 TaxID=2690260 RepID=UPI001371F881|nr:cupin domain-containing protein [Streptomyces sp. SID3343]MYV97869.1 cupin domain-containing protein [Streptomyces sp. SID3343]